MTNRYVSTLKLDLRMQARYGLYYASILTAVIMIVVLKQVPVENMGYLIPVFLVGNMVINTSFFAAGMVLFEKGEGTLQAISVTPLSIFEYLGSKVATLTLLCVAENFAIILLTYGPSFDILPVLLGTMLMSIMYVLAGFIGVARYDSVSEFIMPMAVYTTFLQLPLVDYLGIFKSPVFYAFPAQAPIMLMGSAFGHVETWQIAYGIVYSLICISVAWVWACRAFRKYVIQKKGGD
jgi:fluoroquinolone transport system permease protein